MGVQLAVESLSSFAWNRCPACSGMGVQLAVEYAGRLQRCHDIEKQLVDGIEVRRSSGNVYAEPLGHLMLAVA